MSQIEVTGAYPRCRKSRQLPAEYSDIPMSLDEIRTALRDGCAVAIYVDGWSEPWRCYLDVNDQLRAQCSTAPRVVPLVVSVSMDGAAYTGCDCSCHVEAEDVLGDHK